MKALADILIKEDKKGKIFSCQFAKKDGSLRNMVARTQVSKDVKGTGRGSVFPYLKVFDMKKNQWRQINLTTLNYIKIGGKEYGRKL